MVTISKQLGDFNNTSEVIFIITCQQHNPGKPVKVGHGQEANPQGLFEQPEMAFIQFPFTMGFEYVLVTLCLFSE